jgi:monoamine oxidase
MAEEFTRGCYGAHFGPGTWTSYGQAWRAPAGRIHWAGAECAPQWNGYMEGAVRSGEAAADVVARDTAARDTATGDTATGDTATGDTAAAL